MKPTSTSGARTRVELHLIQSFAPSCLNRDDTNSPKDCEFGGVRRARISSQCLKRAVRTAFKEHGLLEETDLSVRTKRLADEALAPRFVAGRTVERTVAEGVARAVIQAAGLGLKEEKTQYLLFLSNRQIGDLAALVLEHWDEFAALVPPATAIPEGPTDPSPSNTALSADDKKKAVAEAKRAAAEAKRAAAEAKKAEKKEKTKQLDKELQKRLEAIFRAGAEAPELALFGRMIADKPDWNVEAACQVAHALSTHRVSVEFDYYTAVDDLKKEDTAGADMIGTVAFNAACFYRYSVVDTSDLARHVGDTKTVRHALDAFLKASIRAIPTGKQNSMAAHNPPSFVLAVVRRDQPCSLANAFVKPVWPEGGNDLVTLSVKALDRHLGDLVDAYGDDRIDALAWVAVDKVLHEPGVLATLHPKDAKRAKAKRHTKVADLVTAIVNAAVPESTA